VIQHGDSGQYAPETPLKKKQKETHGGEFLPRRTGLSLHGRDTASATRTGRSGVAIRGECWT